MNRLALLAALPSLVSSTLTCRPEGPVVPKPSSLHQSDIFKTAAANLTDALDAAIAGDIEAGWPVKNVSFSIAVVTHDQEDPGVPIWEYHHLAERNTRGTKKLDRDSQYLIGSVTKVISDYILLKSDVDLDAPVTEYLPKLADSKSRIPWGDVSLRMLASHLAGAPTNCTWKLCEDLVP